MKKKARRNDFRNNRQDFYVKSTRFLCKPLQKRGGFFSLFMSKGAAIYVSYCLHKLYFLNLQLEIKHDRGSDMKKVIITINRENGSGGREIACRLGEILDLKVYDKAILESIVENTTSTRRK